MMFVSLGIGIVVAITLISVVSYFTGGKVTTPLSQSALVGTKVPAFGGTSPNGTAVTAPWKSGHPAVLVFFASWCTVCHEELPAVSSYLKSHYLGNVEVAGVNYLDSPSKGAAIAKATGFTYPILEDGGSVTQGLFYFAGLPDTVFVNAKGVVTDVVSKAITTAQLAAGLASLQGV